MASSARAISVTTGSPGNVALDPGLWGGLGAAGLWLWIPLAARRGAFVLPGPAPRTERFCSAQAIGRSPQTPPGGPDAIQKPADLRYRFRSRSTLPGRQPDGRWHRPLIPVVWGPRSGRFRRSGVHGVDMRVFKPMGWVLVVFAAFALASCGDSNSGSDDEEEYDLPDSAAANACLSMCAHLNSCPGIMAGTGDCNEFCGLIYGFQFGASMACDDALVIQFNCREAETCENLLAGGVCTAEITEAINLCPKP